MLNQITESIGIGVSRFWDLEEVIYEKKTAYQNMIIAKTAQGISIFYKNERQGIEE